MSKRTIISSLPKRISARAFAVSVLPTPVGPMKIKEPIGRLALFRPALPLLTASATAATAASWSTILLCSKSSRVKSLSDSFSVNLEIGIWVQRETISAIISGPTTLVVRLFFSSWALINSSNFWSSSFDFFSSLSVLTASPIFSASFFSSSARAFLSLRDLISSGREIAGSLTAEAASSIKSTALSGRNLFPI